MSNYVIYKDAVAFHPGYFIKEIVDESGLTQEDFAKRLGTTPKNLSKLINGDQRLSNDMALKLSRMLGTSVDYWLNYQKSFDSRLAEFESDKELAIERDVFQYIDYGYFKTHFNLPDLPRNINGQIKVVREFLRVASLSVLKNKDLAVCWRSNSESQTLSNIINSNAMVQIAINKALAVEAPKFNRSKFEKTIDYALTLTSKHEQFFPLLQKAFAEAGVIFVVLPNLKNSGSNGATKKIGDNIMLMVNDRRSYSDTFWFTLFHEIGHIINGDYGITFEKDGKEDYADKYAQDKLIPPEAYDRFLKRNSFSESSIRIFAKEIDRDPGIVLGRLQMDGKVSYADTSLAKCLRCKYRVIVS